MSPAGSVPKTRAPEACAFVSPAVSVSPVPVAPRVPTVAIVAVSSRAPVSMVICSPGVKLATSPTLMLVAPAAAAADSDVNTSALLFSSSMFAAETPPTLQPACVYVSHGAGVVWPPSPTMFGSESSEPSTVSVQYLNDDVKVGVPSARK